MTERRLERGVKIKFGDLGRWLHSEKSFLLKYEDQSSEFGSLETHICQLDVAAHL